MSRTLVALLGLSSLAAVSARTHHNDPVPGQFVTGENVADEFQARQMFNDFQVKFQRNYADTNETEYRYSVFRMNLLKIAILNDRNGKPAFGVNGFSDLTEEEFKKGYLGYKPAKPGTLKWNKRLETPVSVNGKITKFYDVASVDWRTKGAVTPVKDQGQCGSCWAFSATEETESMWFLGGNGPLPVLAPQQVVSCDTVDQGCNGGDTPTAYQYIESNGLEPETDYPYTSGAAGVTGSCSYNQNDVVVKIKGYTYATPPCTDSCTSQDEKTLAANLAATGPASICVNAAAWQSYTSGILTASACGSSAYTSLDHCVQLVGYQTDATTGQKYWLVRNSWNTVWGNVGTADAGYIYLEYGTNACGVADEATFVTV